MGKNLKTLYKYFLFATVFFFVLPKTFAQSDIPVQSLPNAILVTVRKAVKDTVKWKWKRGGMANFNMTQNSQKNWAAGGDNFSMAITTYLNGFVYYQHGRNTWDSNIDLNFGLTDATSTGLRKNDDRINATSKYGYKIDSSGKWLLSGLVNVRSQFFDGRQYFSVDSSKLISSFLSPAYGVASAGIDYQPNKYFSVFASPLTMRVTLVLDRYLAEQNLYSIGTESCNVAPGAFISVNYAKDVMKNVNYRANINLFSDYSHNPQNVNFYMTNFLNFKINKYLAATYSLNLIYDDNIKLFGAHDNSPALQVQSQIGIGLSMPFKVGYTRISM